MPDLSAARPLGAAAPGPGWLAEQLPRPLAEDAFVARLVGLFDEVGGSLRARIDGVEHHLDPGLAPSPFVRWMATWIGVAVSSSLPEERQRSVLRAAGPLLGWQGTTKGLAGLLGALTGGAVEIRDGGGVYREGEAHPSDHTVRIRLEQSGGIDEQQLLALVRAEVPADALVELVVDTHTVEHEADEADEADEAETSVAAPEALAGEGYLPPLRGGPEIELPPDEPGDGPGDGSGSDR